MSELEPDPEVAAALAAELETLLGLWTTLPAGTAPDTLDGSLSIISRLAEKGIAVARAVDWLDVEAGANVSGDEFKARRKLMGYTLAGLAAKSGVSESTLKAIERDPRSVKLPTLWAVQKALLSL